MSKDFKRYSSYKLKRLSQSWRKQRGLHNKVRLGHRGYIKRVKIGSGTSSSEKSIIAVVKSQTDLMNLKSAKNTILVFSSNLGKRKKLLLLKKAEELGLSIANIEKDFAQKVEKELQERKQAKAEIKKKKETKQKELDKKAKEKQQEKEKEADKENAEKTIDSSADSETSAKELKEKQKKEQDKILTKKDGL
ncbi:MAG: eL32 family ribosomal protein [Candidatus Woesearchaeota archaeon]